jgi:putative hydroxymethylpyrimidine transport system substrate-binding protein
MKPCLALFAAILAAFALGACGTGESGSPDADARLMLDFQPNAVHSGIYLATTRGYDTALGVRLKVEVPGEGTDAIGLLLSDRIQFAVLDIHDLALAREKGRDLVAVMPLVQQPLAAVLAAPSVKSPRALDGKRVGVTGLPSDDAVLDSVVAGGGGDPKTVRRTSIGFNAVGALLSGKVAAATAFWNVEGVALKQKRPRTREFRVDDFGAPRYPELVLAVRRQMIEDSPNLVQATVTALRRGYREVTLGPEEAVGVMTDQVDGLDRATTQAQLDAVLPAFTGSSGGFGQFDLPALEKWASWEQRFGITRTRPDVRRMFDPSFAKKGDISG